MDQNVLSGVQAAAQREADGYSEGMAKHDTVMLTAQQWTTLQLLVDVIIPPDDIPGGWDTGVGEYLARQFQGALQPTLALYQAGLDALEREAQAIGGSSFATLDSDTQIALLKRIEINNVASIWPFDPATFFALVVEHAMEGYYSDPANGGNRDGVAWHMIGFEVQG